MEGSMAGLWREDRMNWDEMRSRSVLSRVEFEGQYLLNSANCGWIVALVRRSGGKGESDG